MVGLRANNNNIQNNIRQPLLAVGVSILFCFLFLNFLHIYCSFVLMSIFLIFSIFFYFFVKNKDFALIFASVFISSGIFIFNFYKNDIFTNSLQNKDIKITGYIIDMPVYSNNICKYNVQIENIENIQNIKKIPKFKCNLFRNRI